MASSNDPLIAERRNISNAQDDPGLSNFERRIHCLVKVGSLLRFELPSPGALWEIRSVLPDLLERLITDKLAADKVAGMQSEEIWFQPKKAMTFAEARDAVQDATRILLDANLVHEECEIYKTLMFIRTFLGNVLSDVLRDVLDVDRIRIVDNFFASCEILHGERPKDVCGWHSSFAPWLEYKYLPPVPQGCERDPKFAIELELVTSPKVLGGLIY